MSEEKKKKTSMISIWYILSFLCLQYTTFRALILASPKELYFTSINFHEMIALEFFASINFRERPSGLRNEG